MALFVYISEFCRNDARRHSLSDELDRFKDRVESTQSTSHFHPFPAPYLVKKKLGGAQGRLIAELRQQGEHAVVVFLAIMIRGDKAYENQFAVDPVAYGNQHFAHLVTAETLAAYVEERSRVEPPPVKPDPSEAEFGFLYEAFAHRRDSAEEDMIYETLEWKEAVSESRITSQLVRFTDPCLAALKKEPGIHLLDIPGKPGWGIWVHRSEGRLLLIVPVTDDGKEAAERVVNRYREPLGSGSLSQILRASRRAYPAYMLADEETWVEIEQEPVANMALSPEESKVLLSVRNPEGAFPLFVNGRAGSGKSTILQYLFADLLYYYLGSAEARQGMAPPVYLTANGELLRVARSFVERILRSESSLGATGKSSLVEENREIIGEAFREFQPHLLSMVDPATRRERFRPGNRVDYAKFKRLWTEWFGMDREAVRDFGPDISWHVIRSYIKGMSSETLMDPDDYVQLPENQITVTRETFERVYERVWEGRYSQLSEAENFWDDQDLARFIVEEDLAKATHPAVVCDEAQDFTRIELELLLRLNLFSNRSVPPHDLCRVPFAFAGDQFQTLNPTGFRWDSIKASFVEKFILALDPARRSGRADLNYQELFYNYRSTAPIVRFCNGIQALRSALFNMPEMRPQTPWTATKAAFPVVWFQDNDAAFWKRFKETDTFVVIVPCNEGEEAEYVKGDPVLSQNVRFEEGIPQNVLSAARAKGREYPVVVVYGFGEASPERLMEALYASDDDPAKSQDRQLPSQYFINRLYVAASRPKQRLIIVDSDSGINRLWDFAKSEEAGKHVIDAANHGRKIWTEDPEDEKSPVVEGMTMGKAEDLTKESAGDPLENARAFEEDGRARRDSFLLRQASLAYRSGGDTAKATECRARAQEMDGSFLEAGQAYSEAGLEIPEAVRCFWSAGKAGWEQIVEKGKTSAAVSRETEFKWARALLGKEIKNEAFTELVQEVLDRQHDAAFAANVVQDKAWKEGITALVRMVAKDIDASGAKGIVSLLESLETAGVSLPDRILAEINFKAGNLERAVIHWEKAGETKSEDFLKAKAAIEPYPRRLSALLKTRAFDEIIEEYQSHPKIALEAEQWGAVAEAYLKREDNEAAFAAAWEAGNPSLLRRCSLHALKADQTATAELALQAALIKMTVSEEWDALSKFASKSEPFAEPEWRDGPPRKFIGATTDRLHATLTRALARSDKLAEMPGHLQRQFSDFLRRFLRVTEGRWRDLVSVEEAGAAFERGGRFVDAISFYEAVAREANFSEEEKQFARTRWLVSKNRQVDYERGQGTSGKKMSDLQKEVEKGRTTLGIKRITDLPKFPPLDPLKRPEPSVSSRPAATLPSDIKPIPVQELPDPLPKVPDSSPGPALTPSDLPDRFQVKVANFTITHSRQLGRCNISHEGTMQTAFVNLAEKQAGGEVTGRVISDAEWEFEEWNLRLSLSNGALTLNFRDMGSQVMIEQAINGSDSKS